MKILILSLFLTTAAIAGEVDCKQLYKDADSACNSNKVECKNLGACISKRNTCAMDVGSPSACASFDECMTDTQSLISKKPKDIESFYMKKRCIYTWNAGKCYLYNTGMEIFTFPSCPGRRIWGVTKGYDNFGCEGTRKQAKGVNKNCNAKFEVYKKTCSAIKDYKDISQPKICKYLTAKTFPADTEHKGAKSVDDGSRDRYKSIPHGDDGASGGSGGAGTGK